MIPVVVAFTPNYFIPAAVTLQSILKSTQAGIELICMSDVPIPHRQKDKLVTLGGGRVEFRYLENCTLPEGAYVDPRYSAAASYRLLLPELLPDHDKVIYVDCDFIVRQDFAALYNSTELEDKLLAAVYEAPIENQAETWEALGCDSRRYFNSGFLMMNLKQMREEGTSAKLMDALHAEYLEFPDQDALNIVCQGRVLALPPVWNGIRTFRIPLYKKDFQKLYTEDDWAAVQATGNIHFTGGKPWNIFTLCYDNWWKEYALLPENFREEWTVSPKMNILSKIYCRPAGKLAIDALRNCVRKIRK